MLNNDLLSARATHGTHGLLHRLLSRPARAGSGPRPAAPPLQQQCGHAGPSARTSLIARKVSYSLRSRAGHPGHPTLASCSVVSHSLSSVLATTALSPMSAPNTSAIVAATKPGAPARGVWPAACVPLPPLSTRLRFCRGRFGSGRPPPPYPPGTALEHVQLCHGHLVSNLVELGLEGRRPCQSLAATD